MHLSDAHGSQQPDGGSAAGHDAAGHGPDGPGSGSGTGSDEGERIAVAVEILGLLADRTRLALLRRLGAGEADVTTLTEACGASRTSVSQHLARLRLAGLVTTRKDGRRAVYALRHGHLRRLVEEALSAADHRVRHLPPHD